MLIIISKEVLTYSVINVHGNGITINGILCPRLGAERIGRISWLPRAPLGPIFMTGLLYYYRSGRPVIKIGPKGALGSHEIHPIHSAPSLGQSIISITINCRWTTVQRSSCVTFKKKSNKFEFSLEERCKVVHLLFILIPSHTFFTISMENYHDLSEDPFYNSNAFWLSYQKPF